MARVDLADHFDHGAFQIPPTIQRQWHGFCLDEKTQSLSQEDMTRSEKPAVAFEQPMVQQSKVACETRDVFRMPASVCLNHTSTGSWLTAAHQLLGEKYCSTHTEVKVTEPLGTSLKRARGSHGWQRDNGCRHQYVRCHSAIQAPPPTAARLLIISIVAWERRLVFGGCFIVSTHPDRVVLTAIQLSTPAIGGIWVSVKGPSSNGYSGGSGIAPDGKPGY